MEYSLELLQSKTNDFINKLENSKGLHFMALMLTTQILSYSKNFELVYSSIIKQGDKEKFDCTTVSFSYLNNIKFTVTFSEPSLMFPKIINVLATKNGYNIDNFKVATNNVAEAINKIIEYAENKNEKEVSCHKKNIKSMTNEEKVENYMAELEEENEN